MSGISTYLISVLSATMICAVLKRLFGKNDSICMVIHLLTGVFLMVIVVQPILNLSFAEIPMHINAYSADAAIIVGEGQSYAQETKYAYIKEQLEIAILQEASKKNACVMLDIKLSDDGSFSPEQIVISGVVTPYAKSYLSQYIAQTVGIKKENQLWIG